MSMSIAELERTLAQLRLSGARDTLQTRLEQAQASQMTAQELLALLLQDELDRRQSRLIDKRYKDSHLDEKVTLAEIAAAQDDRAAESGVLRMPLHERAPLLEGALGELDRGQPAGRVADRGDEIGGHVLDPVERHLPLVAEVAEEGAFGEPGTLGDVGDGGRLEAALLEELHRGFLEPALRAWCPSAHGEDSSDGTA